MLSFAISPPIEQTLVSEAFGQGFNRVYDAYFMVKLRAKMARRAEVHPDDPRVAATVERLQACSYAMAHPETGELVPACVQHSVLDPAENVALRRLLPLHPVDRPGRPAAATTPA